MSKTLAILSAFTALLLGVPGSCASADTPTPSQIRITADTIIPGTEEFSAEGNVRITYEGVILTADTVMGNATSGDVEASGDVQFENNGRTLKGSTFKYNFKSDIGLATDARAEADGIYFRGAQMTAAPDKYSLKRSRFSTCDLEEPHYHLSARELIIEPDKRLTAKDVRIVFYGKTILRVPMYRTPIGDSGRDEGLKMPTIGFGDHSGVFAGYSFDLGNDPLTIGDLDIRLSSKWFVQGGLKYEQIAGKPFFARATHKEIVRGDSKSRLAVTRLPEVGLRFGSAGTTDHAGTSREAISLSRGLIEPLVTRTSEPSINYVGEIGVGNFSEEPDFRSFWRYDARAMAWLKPMKLGSNTFFSPGVFGRISHYNAGDTYSDIAFRVGLAQRLGSRSYVSLGYINHNIHGSTPFSFDRVDLKNELAGRVGFPIGEYALEIGGRYDLDNKSFFDSEVSISKDVHCLRPKITWRDRLSEFSVGVGLVGF